MANAYTTRKLTAKYPTDLTAWKNLAKHYRAEMADRHLRDLFTKDKKRADKYVLEAGDLEEALQAASAIGDDRLQREAGRDIVPDSFTHGSSVQRVKWFKKGFEASNFDASDTFAARDVR